MLVGFGFCVLRIFECYINWLNYSCFVLLFSHRFSFDLCALAVCFSEQVFLFE